MASWAVARVLFAKCVGEDRLREDGVIGVAVGFSYHSEGSRLSAKLEQRGREQRGRYLWRGLVCPLHLASSDMLQPFQTPLAGSLPSGVVRTKIASHASGSVY